MAATTAAAATDSPAAEAPSVVTTQLAPPQVSREAVKQWQPLRVLKANRSFSLSQDDGLKVGYVLAVTQDRFGRVWIGGEAGLQWYDGIRLSAPLSLPFEDSAAPGKADAPRTEQPLTRVGLLHAQGDTLFIGSGPRLIAYDLIHHTFKASHSDGSGWQTPRPLNGSDKLSPSQRSWCVLDERSIVLVEEIGGGELTHIDLQTGRRKIIATQDSQDRRLQMGLTCQSGTAMWLMINRERVEAKAYRFRDAWSSSLKLQRGSFQNNFATLEAQSVLLAKSTTTAWMSTLQGVVEIDFERRTVTPQVAMNEKLRPILAEMPANTHWRINRRSEGAYLYAGGASFVAANDNGELERLDGRWLKSPSNNLQPPVRAVLETNHEGHATRWILRGDWLQATPVDKQRPVQSFNVHPDETRSFSNDVSGLCPSSAGGLWVLSAQGQMGLQILGDAHTLWSKPIPSDTRRWHCGRSGVTLFAENAITLLQHTVSGGVDTVLSRRYLLNPRTIHSQADHFSEFIPGRLMYFTRAEVGELDTETNQLRSYRPPGLFPITRLRAFSESAEHSGQPDNAVLANGTSWWRFNLSTGEFDALGETPAVPSASGHVAHALQDSPARWLVLTADGTIQDIQITPEGKLGTTSTYLPASALQGLLPYCMFQDRSKALWIGTSQGLVRVDANRNVQFSGVNGSQEGADFNEGACASGSDGRIYMGGLVGWVAINPAAVTSPMPLPAPEVQRYALNDQGWTNWDKDALSLPRDTGLIRFEVGALGSALHTPVNVRYRLLGHNEQWREQPASLPIEFSGLAPGHYELQYGLATGNQRGETISQLSLTIHPHWWASPWAWACYTLLTLGFLFIWCLY
ncbi:MAG: hypothetical protein C4K60_17765 [Ideonella sp. MAG2]|nr:MAG: hypothetical protein C4K60_17765 [Ideonella sp. MAG2]